MTRSKFQPISRRLHGPVDYIFIAALFAAPQAFGFADLSVAVWLAWGIAAAVLAGTLFTRAEWGIWRVMPYRVHLILEIPGGLGMVLAPWVLGFADRAAARNAFLAFGIVTLVAFALSKPEEMGAIRAGEPS